MTIIRFYHFIIFVLLTACGLDYDKLTSPSLPYWKSNFELPLIAKKTGVADLMATIDDTSIIKLPYSNALSSDSILYTFQDTIIENLEPMKIGDTGVKPFNDSIISEMGAIELSPIPSTATPPFSLGEINPSLSALDGQNGAIPSFVIQTIEKSFEFDDFQTATFKSGSLIIEIENQLKIPLNNISIKLKNIDGTYIDSTIIDEVDPNATKSGNINLAGKTLPKDLLIEVDGNSPGSSSLQVLINTSDYFSVKISGSALIVSSAIAKIPPQSSPIEGNGVMPLPETDNPIAEAIFEKGLLKIVINNQLDLDSDLKMIIPNIQNESYISDTLNINIPRKSEVQHISNLIEKYMVIYNGNNFDEFLSSNQEVSYSYTVDLEEPSDYRAVSELDKINVSFYFFGDSTTTDSLIKFSTIKGKIEQQKEVIGPINQSPPSLPENMENFLLKDEYVELALYLKTNSTNIPIKLDLNIQAIKDDSLLVESSVVGWDISERGPKIPIPNSADIINSRPGSIIVNGNASVGNNEDFTTISLVEEISIQSNFIINLPFIFQVKDSTIIELEPEKLTALPMDFNSIEKLNIIINSNNQLGFGADIMVLSASDTNYFADTSSTAPDTLISSFFLNNNTITQDTIKMDTSKTALIDENNYLKIYANLFGDEIIFLSTDSLILKIAASIDYLINHPDSTQNSENQ